MRRRTASAPIVVVGSVNLDIVCRVDAIPRPGETVLGGDVEFFEGGKGANQAVGVARLGHPVRLIGRVGGDEAGQRLTAALVRCGVDVRSVIPTARTPSGMALIATDRHGENSIVVSPGANARLTPADIRHHARVVESAGLVMLQLEIPLPTVRAVLELASRAAVPVMLDPAPAQRLSRGVLEGVTWLTPNESEAMTLSGRSQHRGGVLTVAGARTLALGLRTKGSRNVLITLGEHGCCIADEAGDVRFYPAFRVRAVDSTAAGDAFNAGLAVALLRGEPLAAAARYASAVAALAVTRAGAQPSMPDASAVSRFLRRVSR